MNGDFDLQLNEVEKIFTPRPKTSQSNTSTVRQTTNTFDVDDLLRDLDIPKVSTQLKTTYAPVIFSCQDVYYESHKGGGFFSQSKFCNVLKAEMLNIYTVELTITKRLWTKHQDCVRIIQAYGDQNECLHISCEYSPIGILVSYFPEDQSNKFLNLCVTDITIEKIIKEKFISRDINLTTSSDLTTTNQSFFAQDILKLENQLRSRPILIILEQRCIRLFGIIDLVKEVEKQIEDIQIKYASNMVQLNLKPNQINYLMDIHCDELKALEANYKDTKIIEHLRNAKFLAPTYLQNTIEKQIINLATLCTPIDFEIQEESFRPIAQNECSNLINIGRQYKCHIEIQENVINYTCKILKAISQDHVSDALTAAAIKIHQDDLAEQKVDLVVICSTSMYLRDDILKKAGQSVKQEYIEAAKSSPTEPFETNSGNLKCRKLLFLPWEINRTNNYTFYQSIRNFVKKAVQHAIKTHHTSIAFPSIGCGQINVDKTIIANEMLVEAQKQLLTGNVLLQIIFVILPQQIDVFNAFQSKLDNLQTGNIAIKDAEISYRLSTLKLTIISSSITKQEECKKALNNHIQKSIAVREYLQQTALKIWTQPTINKFYKFCFNQHVVLDMNIQIGYLKLFGSEQSVIEADNEYHKEQAQQSEQARLAVIARDVIWAYKINDNNWEKYSSELNIRIEDEYSSKRSTVSE
ncbi:unnamed protein product [Adineta steineri]|uniref:WWE domain-containing protein n=1 Tax=Adineta steineri TaxID=433720 RepID=A0A815HWI7_9BILA|nr:unnamed protein product [Adineta steineri]CAF1610879.1 unnamed protein product [Adineta steineri]